MVYTQSQYVKNPDFSEEIKIKLPIDLTADYHVLFTFNDVSLKKGTKQNQSTVISVLGYATLQLYPDEKYVW